jgi:hypothetical protein
MSRAYARRATTSRSDLALDDTVILAVTGARISIGSEEGDR